MYCQTCAAEIQTGLNYCNRCGAVVNASLTARPDPAAPVDLKSPVRTLGAAITLTTLLGIIILFIALEGLSRSPLPAQLLGILGVAGILLILVVDVLLIRILSHLVQLPVAAPVLATQLKRPETKELSHAPVQAYMPASTDPLPAASSVTEHTTRSFHPVYQEPRVKS